MQPRLVILTTTFVVLNVCTGLASASSVAFDDAGDPAYSGGWTNGSNGGYGWGGSWQISGAGNAFTASSTTNGGANIDTQGQSWGQATPNIFNDDYGVFATRPFSGDLSVGQSFVIDFDSGIFTNFGSPVPSVQIQLAGQFGTVFALSADTMHNTLDSGGYGIEDGTDDQGFISVPLALTQGFQMVFTLTAPTTYSFFLYSINNSTLLFTTNGIVGYVYNDGFTNSINSVTLETTNSGLDPANWNFFNNMAIIPEPGAVALVGQALALVLLLRQRRS